VLTAVASRAGSFSLGPIDLEVAPGEVLALLGPSGAGKTTLLDTVAGFRPIDSGRIALAGRDITRLAPERRSIGIVFQHAALFPHMTVRENVRFGPRARGDRDPALADQLLERFGLGALAGRRAVSLSGGERQRVALAVDPALLLLDEPLSALDQPTRDQLRVVLSELRSELGIPAVHVTHDREEALSLADRVAVIVAGGLRQVAPARQIATAPADADVARLLGWVRLGEGEAHGGAVAIGDLRIEASLASGRRAQVLYRPEELVLAAAPEAHAARDAPPEVRAALGGLAEVRAAAPEPQLPGRGDREPVRVARSIASVRPTVPLARVVLTGDPPLTALVLHRELGALALEPGRSVEVRLPQRAVRVFEA